MPNSGAGAEWAEVEKVKQQGNQSSATVTIGRDSALALVVLMVGFVAIVIAVAAVVIVKEQRTQDARALESLRHEVAGLREKVDINTAYGEQFNRRISKLEASP